MRRLNLIFLTLVLSAFSLNASSYTKLPSFRSANPIPPNLNNPFLDDSIRYEQSGEIKEADIIKKLMLEHLANGPISGLAFKGDGQAVGIIINNEIYKEQEVFNSFKTQSGDFEVTIKSIKSSYVVFCARKKLKHGNYGNENELVVNLPNLK
tara:strand:+ start:5351 stop:5806 length:456 start_codon:yes stop_codon:yes gene_type:complete